ncbi:hypothetical protein ACFQE1_15360, partial [Halobium palmae]
EGWAQVGEVVETEIDAPVPGLDVYQTMALFENRAFLDEMSALAMADIAAPLSTFFVARVNFVGPLRGVALPDIVETQVTPLVKDRLREQGVRDLGERRTVDADGVRNVDELYAIDGSFHVERQTMRDYPLPNGKTTDVHVDAATVDMRLLYGLWAPRNGETYVAGGAFPTSGYRSASDPVSVTGDEDTGVTVTAEISLPLARPDHRAELLSLVDAVGDSG